MSDAIEILRDYADKGYATRLRRSVRSILLERARLTAERDAAVAVVELVRRGCPLNEWAAALERYDAATAGRAR